MRADSQNVVQPTDRGRKSVRIRSNKAYDEAIVVLDLQHMPEGCATWPAFWTLSQRGPWPTGGEIDIIEGLSPLPPSSCHDTSSPPAGVNLQVGNHMTLHTLPGCTQPADVVQLGKTSTADCSQGTNSSVGCTVVETQPNSFGDGFNGAGGGVWAAQFDVSGIL